MNPIRRTLTDSTIDQLAKAIECIRTFDERLGSNELPIQVIAIFFYVASHNNCHKQAVEEDLEFMTRASTSRNTDWLSKHHRILMDDGRRRPGLGLIKKEPDITDKRRSTLTLTEKGEELMEQVKQILYGNKGTSFGGVKQKSEVKTKENSLNNKLERLAAAMPVSAIKAKENPLNVGIADELERLAVMKEKGFLSDAEFTAAKAKFLK